MKVDYYNNIGIGTIAIASILNHFEKISISKSFLIIPFISHLELTNFLARERTNIKSIEELISKKTSYFSNFNKRFFDSLTLTFNSIQYLIDMSYADCTEGEIKALKILDYNSSMGGRAEKIFKASKNIAKVIDDSETNLYLNLRIEL